MSTATRMRTKPPARQAGSSGNVITSWLNSWAVALRIGRRDAWRHKGRSILILLMICLPVALISGVFTALKTADLDAVDRLPGQLGSAQAVVRVGDQPGRRVVQSIDGMQVTGDGAPSAKSTPLPGTTTASTTAQVAPAVRTYLHATKVVPIAQTSAVSEFDSHRRTTMILRLDPKADATRGMVDLVDGRWPENADEAVVTRTGLNLGLPESGAITIGAETTDIYGGLPGAAPATGPTTIVRVVGIADAAPGLDAHLVLADPSPAKATGLLVERDTPVTWAEVKDANLHGLNVISRDVVENPPSVADQYEETTRYATGNGFSQTVQSALMAVLCTGVFLACGLLAGPAFTVIAARQRRTLAMIASNGATGGQLRRAMLGQALVLGVGGAVLGAALGIGSIKPIVAALDAWRPTVLESTWQTSDLGPLDVPWPQVLLIVGSAALAAVVAAILPARGLSDLDVVAAMRGDIAPKRARRRLPVIGLVLLACGATGLWWVFDRPHAPYYETVNTTAAAVISCLMLVAGALMTVPMILVGVAAMLRRAPLPVRMAARDGARQRGRATSTVAAVMAGTMIFAGSLVMMASYDATSRATYASQTPAGLASVGFVSGSPSPDWAKLITVEAPAAAIATLDSPQSNADAHGTSEAVAAQPLISWLLIPQRCTPHRQDDGSPTDECPPVQFGAIQSEGTVYVVDPAALDRVIPLADSDRAALDRGDIVTTVPSIAAGPATVEQVRESASGDGAVTTLATHPAALVRAATPALADWNPNGFLTPNTGLVLMTKATSRRIGADGQEPTMILARTPHPLTHDQVRRINRAAAEQLGLADMAYLNPLRVERGYESPMQAVVLALALAALGLIVLSTVTATALAVGEARRDLRVVAILGSAPSTPRAMAAALAAITAVVGTAAGYAVGLIPGILASYQVTARPGDPRVGGPRGVHDIVIPWLPLGGTLVIAAAVAALAAWLLVRPNADLARRDSRG